jgi:uncharacterized protein (DUF1800 family)
MPNQAIALMAHLMRRAGFGAPYAELEARAAKGYEATVEDLLHPEAQPALDYDIMLRYKTEWLNKNALEGQQEEWVFRMINTKRPLEEKIALFWHGLFCTGHAKCENPRQQSLEIDMFRRHRLGRYSDLLLQLAQDPAMVFYLDNCMSHKDAINENWGRELLELFSMGVGKDGQLNYTEDDVKEAARAFTGWTVANAMPRYPYGRYLSKFIYDPNDHDDGPKTFLGETGNWNGEDIIRIIAKQPATARFISRHLYNFFVADEPPVPAWQHTPPRDPEAIKQLEDEYLRSEYDIRSMLQLLFNADFFKKARFAKVKSPVETVVGTTRLVGDFTFPKPGFNALTLNIRYMGQDLLNPPTVEGWHTGKEWIDSGTLVERINFTADQVGNVNLPGVRDIIARLRAEGPTLSPERLVDGCLDLLGGYELAEETRSELVALARNAGEIQTGEEKFPHRTAQMLQSIVATTEYLFA